MDFQRIDENTVQCRMTEEEMNSYGFTIEDFFTNKERSREFLESIVERAEEEIGYEVESGMVSMQLMRMPDNSLTITFTDKGEEAIQNMLNQIQNLAGMMDEANAPDVVVNGLLSEQNVSGDSDEELEAATDELEHIKMDDFENDNSLSEEEKKKAFKEHLKEFEKKRKQREKETASSAKVFCFESLHNIEKFAETLDCEKNISSKVYKDTSNGKYYLFIKKGKLKFEEYTRICGRLTEYAGLCSQQAYIEQFCKEHFECIIPKNALNILKEY